MLRRERTPIRPSSDLCKNSDGHAFAFALIKEVGIMSMALWLGRLGRIALATDPQVVRKVLTLIESSGEGEGRTAQQRHVGMTNKIARSCEWDGCE